MMLTDSQIGALTPRRKQKHLRLGKWLKLSQQMNNGDLARCKRTNKVLALSIKEIFGKNNLIFIEISDIIYT